jgi:hypothetical protein
MNISRLQKVPLRELWRHEAHGFTRWLAENLDILGEALGFDLTLVQTEAAAGPFSADILAEDGEGNSVIIENQLEQTDHDHLGKLITYLSNLDAKKAIWITSSPRPEHERAIHWLNETLPADTAFYLMKLEAFRIDASSPAPSLSIVAGPSLESKQAGIQKKEFAERHFLRMEFWKGLLEAAKSSTPSFASKSPTADNWISVGAGKSGMVYSYVIRMQDAQVDMYIDRGDAAANKQIFDALYSRKTAIEESFGSQLDWQKLDEKRGSRIRYVLAGAGLQDQEKWPELYHRMIEAMEKLYKAIQPEINALK